MLWHGMVMPSGLDQELGKAVAPQTSVSSLVLAAKFHIYCFTLEAFLY